jgi:hypothetical protein
MQMTEVTLILAKSQEFSAERQIVEEGKAA